MTTNTKRTLAPASGISIFRMPAGLTILALVLAATVQAAFADEFDTLRNRWLTVITGGSAYDPFDSDISPHIAGIESEGKKWWNGTNAMLHPATSSGELWSGLNTAAHAYDITTTY